jgi:hypothetical protein
MTLGHLLLLLLLLLLRLLLRVQHWQRHGCCYCSS